MSSPHWIEPNPTLPTTEYRPILANNIVKTRFMTQCKSYRGYKTVFSSRDEFLVLTADEICQSCNPRLMRSRI